jgi:hypothetical protein
VKLSYWHGHVPNFGDELNAWLWPLLLPDFFDDDSNQLFLGIGSILFDDYPVGATKLVFGAGYGGYTAPPQIDATWSICFVRGPRTAQLLGIDPHLGIGDPATLLRFVWDSLPPAGEHHAVGFMPHWESALYGAWDTVCAELGVLYIDPCWPVERVLAAIRGCELIVSEAMHGAIVADALRVPWIPFSPLPSNRAKWYDWAESQGLDLVFERSTRSTWLELADYVLHDWKQLHDRLHTYGAAARRVGSALLRPSARAALSAAIDARPYLTSDATVEATTAAMLYALERMRARYMRRVPVLA